MQYLYIFLDVSGNYDFSNRGTTYLVLTSVLCSDVQPGAVELYSLKHELLNQGLDLDIEYFHAAEDRQAVRDRVFDVISNLDHLRVDSLIVEKRKAGPSLRPVKRFYPMMVENLLKYPFDQRGINVHQFDKVFIFMDREDNRRKEREALVGAVKVALARYLKGVPYQICMHHSGTHQYLQIVDYCSWAIYVKWERGEFRPYGKLMHLVKSEFDIFQHGSVIWY